MQIGNYVYRSEFARRYLAQGHAEGRAKGEAEGRIEGRAEGCLEGEAQALLRILHARGLSVSEAERARMVRCDDRATLDEWLERALTASRVAEVFSVYDVCCREFARRFFAKGRAEGEVEGRAEGRLEGKAVGRVEGHARALLRILGARGLSVSDAERGEILCCAELTVLDAWIERALTARSVAEVLGAAK